MGFKKNTLKRLLIGTLCLVLGVSIISPASAEAAIQNKGWKWPVPASDTISSCYLDGRDHYAIDIVGSKGTPIYACYEGTVIATYAGCSHNYGKKKSCGCGGGLGNYVFVRHNYEGTDYVSRYGHLTAVSVKVGDAVTTNTMVGTMGSTGSSSGHHLDLKMYRGSTRSFVESRDCVDPIKDGFIEVPITLKAKANTSCCYTYVKEARKVCFDQGWNEVGGQKYLLNANREILTGWQLVGSEWYYMYSDGTMARDTWIGQYYVNESGVWETSVQKASWVKDNVGWWYRHADGSYTSNGFEVIDGETYLFDARGYRTTGWQLFNGSWYYMYSDGKMAKDTWIGSYYVNGDGVWVQPEVKSGWLQDNVGWWYRHTDGSYTTNGWEYIDGYWYLFDRYGYRMTGWQKTGGYWYYMYSDGKMAANTWVGPYYVNASGAWVENKTK